MIKAKKESSGRHCELIRMFGAKKKETLIEIIEKENPAMFWIGLELVKSVREKRLNMGFYAKLFQRYCNEMGIDTYETYKVFSEET